MDSPSDLSPNAPHAGFDDPFKNIPENPNAQQGTASTEGSVDSSGFEKVEHDVLEEYRHNFNQQMQQAVYGQLPDDPDGHEDDFVIVSSTSLVQKMEDELPGVTSLRRIPAEIDKPYPADLEEEISPRHLSPQKESTPESAPRESTPPPKEAIPSPAARSKEASPEPNSEPEHHEHVPNSRESSAPHDDHKEKEHQIDRSPSPVKRSQSPIQRSASPVQQSPSPVKRSVSPVEHSPSPTKRSPSPIQHSPSPVQRSSSPVQGSPSPVHVHEEPYHVEHHEPSKSPIENEHHETRVEEPFVDVKHEREQTPLSEEERFPDHPVPPEEMEKEQHQDHFTMEDKHYSHNDQHHGHPVTDDLIDIPRNDSPVHELDYGHRDLLRSDSPLIPETHSFHHEEDDLPFPHHEEHHPEPVYDFESHQNRFTDDLLGIGQQAKELVDEAVQEAGDKIHSHAAMDTAHNVSDEVQHHVDSIHHEVDDVLEQMNEDDDFKEIMKAQIKDSDDEGVPDFRSTPEPEERPYERHGPLTIPEIPDQQEEEDDLLDDVHHHVHHDGHRYGFETEPRPPTPPKDISDEDVKPSLVNLGHGHHVAHSHADSHHSILKHSAEPWFDFKHVDPCVLDLVYWRDPKKSAIALSLSLLAVFVLAKYPLLSILSYSGLAVLAGTLGFRIFKAVEGQIKKTGGENPFQDYLNQDLNVPQDKVHAQVDVLSEHAVCLANKAKKLIFVENIFESVKFVLLLWSLTYVSAWFSGFGLIILTILGIFTIPKVYETYQEPIDQQLAVITGHINNVVQLVEEKLPFLKRADADAEKKDQ